MNTSTPSRMIAFAVLCGCLIISAVHGETLVDKLAADDRFTLLLAANDALGDTEMKDGQSLGALLSDPEKSLTVFAPTNDALEKLMGALNMTGEQLLGEIDTLAQYIKFHIVDGKLKSTDDPLAADDVSAELETFLEGEMLAILKDDNGLLLNGEARVTEPDIEADNGVIHAIDTVMTPKALQMMPGMPGMDIEIMMPMDPEGEMPMPMPMEPEGDMMMDPEEGPEGPEAQGP